VAPSKPLNYGGQAIMEGVMMRGASEWAACVRAPSGEIVTRRERLPAAVYRSRVLSLPFLRGLVMLWDSLGLGMQALMWSADVSLGEDSEEHFSGPLAWGTIAVSLALGIGLFVLLPMYCVSLLDAVIASAFWSNLMEGGVRLALFVGYLAAIGRMPEIRRVFAYHGAEHKTINAYEAGAELTPESVARFTTAHTRCGTSFLLSVMLISIIVFAPFHFDNLFLRLASRLLLIPVVAGIAYEFMRFTAARVDNPVVRALITPGLLLQRLTTREPELPMIECAIAALKPVLAADGIEVASAAPAPAVQVPVSA